MSKNLKPTKKTGVPTLNNLRSPTNPNSYQFVGRGVTMHS